MQILKSATLHHKIRKSVQSRLFISNVDLRASKSSSHHQSKQKARLNSSKATDQMTCSMRLTCGFIWQNGNGRSTRSIEILDLLFKIFKIYVMILEMHHKSESQCSLTFFFLYFIPKGRSTRSTAEKSQNLFCSPTVSNHEKKIYLKVICFSRLLLLRSIDSSTTWLLQ